MSPRLLLIAALLATALAAPRRPLASPVDGDLQKIHATLLAHAERTAPPDVVARVRAAVAAGGADGHRALLSALIDAEHAAGSGGDEGGASAVAASVAGGAGKAARPTLPAWLPRGGGGGARAAAARGEL